MQGRTLARKSLPHPCPNQTPAEKLAAQAEIGGGGGDRGHCTSLSDYSEKASLAWGAGKGSPGGKKQCSSLSDSAHVKMNSVPFKNQQSCNF